MFRISFCFVAIIAAGILSQVQAQELKVGDQAPNFQLVGSDGKTYQLSDFAGKQAVVVAWFPRAFTGGCTKECKSLKADGDGLRKYNVAYFTASTDSAEKNAEFAKSLDLDYPILSDPDGKTAAAYGIYNADKKAAARVTFIIDRAGKIAAIERNVKTESHGADLAGQLKELGIDAKK